MHQLELNAMLSRDGIYILGDVRYPTFTMAVVVAGSDRKTGKPGTMHTLVCGRQCSGDVEQWAASCTVACGPITVQSCESVIHDEEAAEMERDFLSSEVEAYKGVVDKALPILNFAVNVCRLLQCQEAGLLAQEILDEIAAMKKAEAAAEKTAEWIAKKQH